MKKAKLKPAVRYTLIAAAVVIAAGVIWMLRPADSANAAGRAYLSGQSAQDTAQIEKQVTAKKNEHLMESVKNGNTSIFSLYRNSLILGDSRVYGFGSYGFVPNDQVLAEAGNTILNITDHKDLIARVQPQVLYFSYGVNDMGLEIGKDKGENGYGQTYEEQIKSVLEVSPASKVVVNSIIPVTPDALARSPRWDKTADYNKQMQEMCERNGWIFVDNTSLADNGNAPIYQGDGVHFLSDFYPVWASNMLFKALE